MYGPKTAGSRALTLSCVVLATATATLDAQEAQSATARLYGTVVDKDNGRAIEGVLLTIKGTEIRTESNRQGNFVFEAIPPGTVEVVAERLGVATETQTFELEPGRKYDVELRLSAKAVALDPIAVTVEARSDWLEMQGFYERKYYGGLTGHFITRAEIEHRNAQMLTDIYDDVPRVQSFWIEPGRRTVRFRHVTGLGGGYGCEPAYFIDGHRYYDPLREGPNQSQVANFNAIGVDQAEAIEVYVGAAVPIQYQAANGANCGVILLWTRRGSR